jgi:hypothetical protein
MSVSFFGKTPEGRPIHLDPRAIGHLNLSNENARALLLLLGIDPARVARGEMTLADARRALIFARATFERRVPQFTRSARDTKPPGKVRVIDAGITREYLARRLGDLERFLDLMSSMGATSIAWT